MSQSVIAFVDRRLPRAIGTEDQRETSAQLTDDRCVFADARYPSTSMRFRCMRYLLSSSRSRSWGRT